MSRHDTTIAAMVNQHALFGVRVRFVLAWITFRRTRAIVLADHLAIIKRREGQLGEGSRPRSRHKEEAAPVLLDVTW
jgi:hypothetical protein